MAESTCLPAHVRILVVDDEPSQRRALQKILASEGYVVACAEDGPSALAETLRFRPDIVLSDLQMRGFDGIELCGKLRELDPELPFLLMTAHDDVPSVLRGLRARVDDYLTKPLDVDRVLWSLKRTLERRAATIERDLLRRQTEALYEETRALVKRYEDVRAIIAHDLRNPLGTIEFGAQLLQESPLDDPTRMVAKQILRAAHQMGRLVADLLDEARLGGEGISLERREHRVEDLLGDVTDLRPLALQRGLSLDVAAAPADGLLFCDRARLAQVFSNLVGNAIKFSPRGSTINVWVEALEGGFCFGVRDQGPGIKADALPHLFERFWQPVEHRGAGVGLGLYIVKGVVEAHGGSLSVESTQGSGSTFLVTLPTGGGRERATEGQSAQPFRPKSDPTTGWLVP